MGVVSAELLWKVSNIEWDVVGLFVDLSTIVGWTLVVIIIKLFGNKRRGAVESEECKYGVNGNRRRNRPWWKLKMI